MHVLIAIALKSLLIAGIALGLLALMKRRSAAERSWVAHIGLLALVTLAFSPLVLPYWTVEAPSLLGEMAASSATTPQAQTARETVSVGSVTAAPVETTKATTPASTQGMTVSATAATMALYAIP